MSGRYTREMHEAHRKEQDERARKDQEQRQERSEKESARGAWLADGGTREGFEAAWPKLRDEGRKRRVMDADKRAREEMRATGVSRI